MEKNLGHASLRIPPPLIFLAFLVGALVLNWVVPVPEPWASVLRGLGGLSVLVGLTLGFLAVAQMRQAKTSPNPERPTTALVTRGPYRFTRNPIYLGFVLIFLGFTLLAGTLWGLLLSPFLVWAFTAAVIRKEEGYLRGRFPVEYGEYLSRVGRWF